MSFRDRHPGTIADALTRPGPVISVRPDGAAGDDTHIWWLPDGRIITQGLGDVPTKSRYQAGDWVRLHGHPGSPYTNQRHGMRGIVLGSPGSTLLEGITDDGRLWVESRGGLDPDGRATESGASCVCCPRPHLAQPAAAPPVLVEVEQLGLFDLIGAA